MESEKVKEIKKALECCKQNEIENTCEYCSKCPASDWDYETECNVELFQKSLTLINELESEITKLDIINSKLEMDIELLNKQNIDLEIDRDYYQEQFNEQEDFYVEWNKQQLKQFYERLKEELKGIVGANFIDETLKEFIK